MSLSLAMGADPDEATLTEGRSSGQGCGKLFAEFVACSPIRVPTERTINCEQ